MRTAQVVPPKEYAHRAQAEGVEMYLLSFCHATGSIIKDGQIKNTFCPFLEYFARPTFIGVNQSYLIPASTMGHTQGQLSHTFRVKKAAERSFPGRTEKYLYHVQLYFMRPQR